MAFYPIRARELRQNNETVKRGRKMAVTAAQVKELRERTSGAMMDCKKALDETGGDMEAAIKYMREAGLAKAAKKASRVAAEGVVLTFVSPDNKEAIILEINCETDFVARDENFTQFCEKVGRVALENKMSDVQALLALPFEAGGDSIDATRQALVVKIGENITVRRCHYLASNNGAIGAYIHGGRIGVLLELNGDDLALAKDIAMHVAAVNPEYLKPEDVAAERVAAEKAILIAQAKESGKPEDIIEKMITGRLKKFVNEVSLYGQSFVKNPDLTVGQLVEQAKASVRYFVRYEVGEGIEKETVDFAQEVMSQVRGE